MTRKIKVLLVGGAIVVAIAVPTIAQAAGGTGDGAEVDVPITGPDLA